MAKPKASPEAQRLCPCAAVSRWELLLVITLWQGHGRCVARYDLVLNVVPCRSTSVRLSCCKTSLHYMKRRFHFSST